MLQEKKENRFSRKNIEDMVLQWGLALIIAGYISSVSSRFFEETFITAIIFIVTTVLVENLIKALNTDVDKALREKEKKNYHFLLLLAIVQPLYKRRYNPPPPILAGIVVAGILGFGYFDEFGSILLTVVVVIATYIFTSRLARQDIDIQSRKEEIKEYIERNSIFK